MKSEYVIPSSFLLFNRLKSNYISLYIQGTLWISNSFLSYNKKLFKEIKIVKYIFKIITYPNLIYPEFSRSNISNYPYKSKSGLSISI